MGGVLELIKPILMLTAACGLSGCGASLGDMTQAVLNPAPEPQMVVPGVNRAAIEDADLAAVMMLNPDTKIATVGIAIQMREGRINYSSNENRGVTLNGGLIYATLGLGTNLQAVMTAPDDPLVQETHPDEWPAQVSRTLFVPQRGSAAEQIETTCTVRVGSTADIEVVGLKRSVVEVVEDCTSNDGTGFANVHALDARTGRVWRTSQWTGPTQGNIQVDVIDQFDLDG